MCKFQILVHMRSTAITLNCKPLFTLYEQTDDKGSFAVISATIFKTPSAQEGTVRLVPSDKLATLSVSDKLSLEKRNQKMCQY